MPKVKGNACAVYDWTLKAKDVDREILFTTLPKLFKKWAFQLETSETGYVHYQGRGSLFVKKREGDAIKLFQGCPVFKGVHLSVTSNAAKGDAFYVMKEDTRTEGPWTSVDKKAMYVPRHIREVTTLRPFQKTILDMAKIYDQRKVDIIFCPKGNTGKTTLIGKARAAGYRVLPPVREYKDIMQMVYGMPTATAYFIDMPRAIRKDKLGGFFSGLETIKDGYCYDGRYVFKEKCFDSPRIFLFTNDIPDAKYLSADRWAMWSIDSDYKLIKHVPQVPDSIPVGPPPPGPPATAPRPNSKDEMDELLPLPGKTFTYMGDTQEEQDFLAQYDDMELEAYY